MILTKKLAHLTQDELDALVEFRLNAVRKESRKDKHYGWDLPWDGFMRRMRLLTPQSYGGRIERYMSHHHGWGSVNQQLDRGDAVDAAGSHWEIKTTLVDLSDGAMANFLHMRQHQDIAGYHLFAIDSDNRVTHFTLTKAQMAFELEQDSSLTHGTKGAEALNARPELTIRLAHCGERWNQWVADYAARSCRNCPR